MKSDPSSSSLSSSSSSLALLDVRLVWYFGLTTINSVLDIIFQDETALLSALVAVKTATLYYYYSHHHYHHDGITTLALRAMGVCLLATTYYWWTYRMPALWDSTMWSMQTDTVVGLWLLFHHRSPTPTSSSESSATNKKDSTTRTTTQQEPDYPPQEKQQQDQPHQLLLCQTVAQMFGCYYAAAAFFKLNRHFFDPNASCATVFVVQHICYYLGPLVSYEQLVQICTLVKPYAPIITVSVELAMASSLVVGQMVLGGRRGRTATRVGLLLILYFHLAVCMTPRPHDISLFAYQCGARLIVALDATSLQHAVRWYVRPYRTQLLVVGLCWIWYGYYYVNFTPLNWAFAAYVPVLVLHTTAIRIEAAAAVAAADPPKKSTAVATTTTTTTMIMMKKPFWSYLAVLVAFYYSFGSIILGLQEEHTCNVFANLKIHGGGGSNHYLVPTGLLLRYDGPEIRIQNSTSWWFTTTYPADLSHTVEPRNKILSVMADIGNPTPFMFNGGANRVLELFQRGYVPHNGIFVMYTVPIVEFLRRFDEAIRYDVNFDLEYVELPDDNNNDNKGDDEHWRATAAARTVRVRVQVKDGTIVQCTVVVDDDNDGRRQPCAVDRDWVYRPYRQHVSWWRRKLSMYHGYPIVFRKDGTVRPSLTCFGP
jgi:hypothetical protein